jgi:DNA-binding CsgD family transcriptional regulator
MGARAKRDAPVLGDGQLVGRSIEFGRLRALLADASDGRGGASCVTGPAGIGKSALLDALSRDAIGWTVLRMRASPGREMLAYSGLRELLGSVAGRGGSSSSKLGALLSSDDAHDPAEPNRASDPFSVGLVVLEFLARLADDHPVLCVVDDAHWLDPSSVAALEFAVRRMEGDRAAFVFACREGEPGASHFAGFNRLVVAPLSAAASTALIGDQMAGPVASQVVEAAAGNPLVLIEACRLLPEAQRQGRAPLQTPLPVPSAIEASFLRELDAVSADARLAILVASCDERLDRQVIEAVCEGLEIAHAESAVATAVEAGLLCEGPAGLGVVHPLLASAIYQSSSDDLRRAVHRSIAGVLRRSGDLERRAWHFATACERQSEDAAALLDQAGSRALARGDPNAAAACFRRAGELSEDGAAGLRRARDAGEALVAAGRNREAVEVYEAALERSDDIPTRVGLLTRRCLVGGFVGDPAKDADRMSREIAHISTVDRAAAATVAVHAANVAFATGSLSRAASFLETARSLDLDPAVGFLASGLQAILWAFQGDVERAGPALREQADAPGIETMPFYAPYVANLLSFLDEFECAERILDAVAQACRASGSPGHFPYALIVRAELRLRTGRFLDSRADADDALDLVGTTSGDPMQETYARCVLARAEGSLGRVDDARLHAGAALAMANDNNIGFAQYWAAGALGYIEVAANHMDDAIPHLEYTAEFAAREGLKLLTAVPWAPDLVEAYVHTGRIDDALRVVRRVESEAGPHPTHSIVAIMARCRGLTSPVHDWDRDFEHALDTHKRLPNRFETARTHLCYGERLRREQRVRDATHHLERAAELFDRAQAPSWRDRARRELGDGRALSARASPIAALTPREYQVAQAVAAGATNREAAGALFLSRRTLEFHLQSVYRKLGIRSRTELANAFKDLHEPGTSTSEPATETL